MADLSAKKREKLPAKDFGLPEKARTKTPRSSRATTRCRTRSTLATPRPGRPSSRTPATSPRTKRERIDRKADKVLDK